MTHELKTWPPHFEAVADGRKTFELRRNDREFAVGDVLVLKEYDPVYLTYSGAAVTVRVTYIMTMPFVPGYVAMSIKKEEGA